MTAWCENCNRFINQKCDRCGENFGVTVCEKYACGGTMFCPFCGNRNLTQTKKFQKDPYDYRDLDKNERIMGKTERVLGDMTIEKSKSKPQQCVCGEPLKSSWNFCPNCGSSTMNSEDFERRRLQFAVEPWTVATVKKN